METTVIIEREVPFGKFYVVPLADFHIGAKACAVDVIQGYLNWIKERDNAYTVLNGDLMNCATKSSTPELYEDRLTPDDAYSQLRSMLMPIKDKVLMVIRGGHEEHIYRSVGHDYSAELAFDLGDVPYRADAGMAMIYTPVSGRRAAFRFYATHGWGGARTIGAKIKKVEELAIAVEADVYILSHDHTQNVHRLNRLVPSDKHDRNGVLRLIPHRQLLVNTGGFLMYDGYVARKGYVPQDLGTPRIRCEIKRDSKGNWYKDLHSSI